jgi:hypothetical protein
VEQVAIDALVMESAWLREENVALRINAVYLFQSDPARMLTPYNFSNPAPEKS